MIVTLQNGRKIVVKFRYVATAKDKWSKDKYGRDVNTIWQEHTTIATIWEWTQDDAPHSRVKYTGMAFCSYKDKYSKPFGKRLALERAIEAMAMHRLLTIGEAGELCGRLL